MKKVCIGMFIISFILIAFFMNCKNINGTPIVTGYNLKSKSTLTVMATGGTENVVFTQRGNSRSILPASLDGNTLYFYLWGEDKLDSNNTLVPAKIDFFAAAGSNGRSGTIELELETSQYELILVATENPVPLTSNPLINIENILSKAVLYSSAIADMRYNQKVNFYLSPYSIEGNGNVRLKVYYLGYDDFGNIAPLAAPYTNSGNVSFGLYNINNDNPANGKASAFSPVSSTEKLLTSAEISSINCVEPSVPNYEWYEIPKGTYNFKVKFFDTENNKVFLWSDTLLILANQTTEATVVIPNVIGKLPSQPVNFTAKYVDPESEVSGYYDVEFLWKDVSNNEQFFGLDLLDVSALVGTRNEAYIDTVIKADGLQLDANDVILDSSKALNEAAEIAWEYLEAYAGPSSMTSFDYEVIGTYDNWVAGSLHAGSEYVVLRLPLGKRYIARLNSANGAGHSKNTYLGLDRPDEDTPGGKAAVLPVPYYKNGQNHNFVPTAFPQGTRAINRFRITYNFGRNEQCKATYYDTSYKDINGEIQNIGTIEASQVNVRSLSSTGNSDIRYYSQTSNGNIILNPLKVANENTLNQALIPYFSLAKGGDSWTSWKLDSESGINLYEPSKASAIPSPDQVLNSTTVGLSKGYDNPYTGFENINLFATYSAVGLYIYNPADYSLLSDDIIVYKSRTQYADISQAVQVATIDKARAFIQNSSYTFGFPYIYFAVRKDNYQKIELAVENNKGGLRSIIRPAGTLRLSVPRRVLTTTEPLDFTSNYSSYYSRQGNYFEALSSSVTWEKNKYYMLIDDGSRPTNFDYFYFPAYELTPESWIFRIKAYTSNNPETPFSYPICVYFKDGITYSATTFEPLDFSTNYDKYYEYDGSDYVQNTQSTWSRNVFQEN